MAPKPDQRRGYASKPRLPPHRPVAINPGKKPVAGPLMRQVEGQEIRQITIRCLSSSNNTGSEAFLQSAQIDLGKACETARKKTVESSAGATSVVMSQLAGTS